jgi:hypothetical protein
MNEMDRWIYLDGPAPAELRPLIEALRAPVPIEEEANLERMKRGLLARFKAMRRGASLAESAAAAREAEAPVVAAVVEAPARWAALRAVEAEAPGVSLGAVEESAGVVREGAVAAIAGAEAEVAKGAARLVGTAPVFELPEHLRGGRGALPFKSAAEMAPAPAVPGSAKTLQIPVMKGPGDTVGVGDTSIEHAMKAGALLGGTVGRGVVPIPDLAVAHFAVLCVELWVRPEREADLMRAYKVVSKAALNALFAYWKERFAARPAEWAEFEAAREEYLVVWRRQWEAGRK